MTRRRAKIAISTTRRSYTLARRYSELVMISRGSYRIRFKVKQQSFAIAPDQMPLAQARFIRAMLGVALERLIEAEDA